MTSRSGGVSSTTALLFGAAASHSSLVWMRGRLGGPLVFSVFPVFSVFSALPPFFSLLSFLSSFSFFSVLPLSSPFTASAPARGPLKIAQAIPLPADRNTRRVIAGKRAPSHETSFVGRLHRCFPDPPRLFPRDV